MRYFTVCPYTGNTRPRVGATCAWVVVCFGIVRGVGVAAPSVKGGRQVRSMVGPGEDVLVLGLGMGVGVVIVALVYFGCSE